MKMGEVIEQIRKLSQELEEKTREAKAEVVASATVASLPGQTILRGGGDGPEIFTLKSSALDGRMGWLPQNYSPRSQRLTVMKALEKCRTAEQLLNAVRDLLSPAYRAADGVRLHPFIVRILRESEVGRLAMGAAQKV